MTNEILNTCYLALESQDSLKGIVSFSHIIPVALSLILGFFVFFKSKFSYISKIFLSFVLIISIWLIGDYFAWTSDNYNIVYFTWSFLDYTEILFYILGLYFAILSYRKIDISNLNKLFFLLRLPA